MRKSTKQEFIMIAPNKTKMMRLGKSLGRFFK